MTRLRPPETLQSESRPTHLLIPTRDTSRDNPRPALGGRTSLQDIKNPRLGSTGQPLDHLIRRIVL
jgi:uncharacterized protein (UPF0264 family)